MHIKEIIIEGFKSYASRTVIKGFDPQFNAITGLNGSGKSNILDAILFVIGLSQLSLARVVNLQELIYKCGNAGVTKASVTLIMDNSDRKNSPNGYEDCDIINITRQISQGKSKYFLNGHNETTAKIKNLFKSVQLNIDNPHFLVAQGRITKIINLKPGELIAMLEESAGTALYNDKKKESRKIMEKKEEKLREINEILKREIEPQMEKLRKERETYLLWKSGELELKNIKKQLSAFEYFCKTKILQKLLEEISELREIDTQLKHSKDSLNLENSGIEKKIELYEHEKHKNGFTRDKKTILDEKFNEKQKQVIQIESELKNMMRTLDLFEKDQTNAENSRKENSVRLAKLTQMIDFSNVTLKEYELALKEKKAQFEEAKRNFQSAKNDNVEEAYEVINKQLDQADKKHQDNENHINRLKQKINQIKEQLEIEKTAVETSLNTRKNETKGVEVLQYEIEKLDEDINNFENTGDFNILSEQKRRIDEEIMRMNHSLSSITEKNWQFQLKYRDPEPNFDRRKVKGKVFQLISATESKYMRALEQCAAGRIYNIIVDNENTAKLLMKKECFHYHVNLIPNNKIQGQAIQENVIRMAENIAQSQGGFAIPAYRLVHFDKELTNSMEYVFGNTFICNNTEIAKKIAFHPEIRKRCVNLDGDIFDPNGTLTGGYVNPNDSILARNEEYKKISQQIEELRKEQRNYDEKIAKVKKDQDYLSNLKTDLESKTLKLNLLKEKMKRNSNAKMHDKHVSLENDQVVFEEQIEKLLEIQKKHIKEIEELKQEKKRLDSNSASKDMKDVWKEKMNKLEGEVARLNEEIASLKKNLYKSEVDRENTDNELKRAEGEYDKGEEGYENLKKGYGDKKKMLFVIRREFENLIEEKKKIEENIVSVDSKLNSLLEEKDKIKKKIEILERETKKSETNINKNLKESRDMQEAIKNLEKIYPFILNEKDFFGISNTEFDFEEFNINEKEKRFFQMEQEQQNLQKRVNLKVEAMSDKVEKEYKDLIEKRIILEQDKTTLNVNMEELDKKKREALEKCYLSVNEHFGNIFSTLLPGTFAKIQQFPGKDLSDGLEIGVSFNNVWKTSLSELSGGQRSLLALSFILSLLRYKPAPFYILDEIDAALDLSHTENIGAMISQHFSQSQFLIISLKDGMFNNANVLFKTSFVDGLSKVDRMVLKNKEKLKIKTQSENEEKENVFKDKKNKMVLEGK